jgi:hypothetical protein
MAIYEGSGHGEPRELIVECREVICENWKASPWPADTHGHCKVAKDITITFGGMCNKFKEKY